MFYDVDKAAEDVLDSQDLIFAVIKQNYREVILKIIDKIDLDLCDDDGNNVMMCLLKNRNYDIVLQHINSDFDINHQNDDGDTLLHLVVTHNYLDVKDIVSNVLKNKKFIPNLKNKKGETILDKSINSNYLYTSAKILEDRRFNDINLVSFKNYYEAYIKNNEYGKYSKLSNFTLIMNTLSKKKLLPSMHKLINTINENEDIIKNDFFMAKTSKLENIINDYIRKTI